MCNRSVCTVQWSVCGFHKKVSFFFFEFLGGEKIEVGLVAKQE